MKYFLLIGGKTPVNSFLRLLFFSCKCMTVCGPQVLYIGRISSGHWLASHLLSEDIITAVHFWLPPTYQAVPSLNQAWAFLPWSAGCKRGLIWLQVGAEGELVVQQWWHEVWATDICRHSVFVNSGSAFTSPILRQMAHFFIILDGSETTKLMLGRFGKEIT